MRVMTNFGLLGVSVKFVSTVLRQASHHNAVTDMFVHTLQDTFSRQMPDYSLTNTSGSEDQKWRILCILQFLAQRGVLVLAAAVCSLIGLIELG